MGKRTQMNQQSYLQSIFIGQPKTITDALGAWTSSIYRDPVFAPVRVQKGGLVGDKVAQPYHGGADADICVHLLDHYRFWQTHYGLDLHPGFVGENFTLDAISEEQICAGDIVKVGTAFLQVTGPRTPCANLARRIGRKDWVKLTVRENRTGFYMRVLEAGVVQPGDTWQLQERFNRDGTIPAINRCLYLDFDPAFAQRMAQMHGLGDWWKQQAIERGEQLKKHWTATMKDFVTAT
jgi:MOSC domain-containing protein YiiM